LLAIIRELNDERAAERRELMAAEEDRRRVEREREEARIEALRLETSARGENKLRRRSIGSADGAA
jgi:hypothetical protein